MRRVLVGALALGGLPASHAAYAQPAAARLDASRFSTSAPADTLLHIARPGRFAITTQSATGTALDLTDMITGPTPPDGTPGSADGRLDLLLDAGVCKIRLHPAAGAAGDVQLRAAPYTDAAPPAIMPHNAEADATLADLQQRSFWFTASGTAPVRIEAAGRALADSRLWRNGRDLTATPTSTRTIEPTRGHPLRDILIDGALPAGTYRATAYGGLPLPWADGSTAQPFHVREGAPDTLRPGWVGGRIGPFGSQVFRAAGSDDLIRLSLKGLVGGPVTLDADGAQAAIAKQNRVPEAELRMSTQPADHAIEVTGPQGTSFALRATMIGTVTSLDGPANSFVTANTTGLGGDNVPATLVLARSNPQGWSVAGSNAPEISRQAGWHHRFSLGGEVSLLFHATEGGKLAATVTGMRLGKLELTALDALAAHPPLTPDAPGVWDVPAGWYALSLAPAGNTAGVADVTLAPPGVGVPLAPPSPPSPSVSFGVQSLGRHDVLRVFGNAAPNAQLGLDTRPVPVALDTAPLRVGQEAGAALAIPVKPDTGPSGAGELAALEYGAGRVPVSYDALTGTAQLPAVDHARLVALFWERPAPPPAMPVPEPETARITLHDGAPRFFDLAEDAPRSFTLDIGGGGLFRVETLGRLHTSGAIGSHFVPELETAEANGVGENMLLQGFLRAGQYHVDVTAKQSSGRAGIVAQPAPLLTAASLLPGGTVRATLPAGTALLVPVSIAQAGTYRIDLLGLGKTFNARLEDAQGWPFAASAPFATDTQDLAVGQYRLLVSPEAVDARAVARLSRIETPPPLAGHGPHDLPFDAPQHFTWREPAGRNDPRQPDQWRFALAAPADITLSITDGMEAVLRDAAGHDAAHLAAGTPFAAHLAAGAYRVEALSQGRNDRLDYTVSLTASQLQPGVPRGVTLPASVGFAVAADQVVSLTSFGSTPVRAVLKDATGRVLERTGARAHDWNIALSRLLPRGAYTLDLASAAPPPQHAVPKNVNDGPTAADRGTQGDAAQDDAAPADTAPANTAPADTAQSDASPGDNTPDTAPGDAAPNASPGGDAAPDAAPGDAAPDAAPGDNAPDAAPGDAAPDAGQQGGMAEPAQSAPGGSGQDADAGASAAPDGDTRNSQAQPNANGETELTLALPADRPTVSLAGGGASLSGGGVQHLALPRPEAGQLILAGAASAAELVLSLEQEVRDQPDGGTWRSRAVAQGLTPLLAMPADGSAGAWRLSVWPVDGGTLPIRLAASLETTPAIPGQPALQSAPLPGVSDTLAIAHVALSARGVVALSGRGAPTLLAGAWRGHQAMPAESGLIAPQDADLWLIAPDGVPPGSRNGSGRIMLTPLKPGARLAMNLPAGARAALPAQGAALTAWIAQAPGQPGLNGGHGMGVAEGSTLALARREGATIWNAGQTDMLLVSARPIPLSESAAVPFDARPSWTLPPRSAAAITLPAGPHTLRLDLPPGTAAVAGWPDPHAVTMWSGHDALSRTLEGSWQTVLLVNTTRAAAPVGLATESLSSAASLRPGHAVRRFFGAAGSIDIPVSAQAGQSLVVAGEATATFAGDDGKVLRGTRFPVSGPGRLILQHGPGLVAAWLDGKDAAPWPAPKPIAVTLPASAALSGEAMAYGLPAAPCLLRIRSTAPIILALNDGQPELFPAGAAVSRYLPAGPATLRIMAPQDGGLSGSLDLTTAPVRPATDGLGAAVAVAPGDTALFGFSLSHATRIGMAVRAQPDDAALTLLDASGQRIAAGAAMLRDLPAGQYILSAAVPAGAPTTVLRPAILGLAPRPNGPPPDIIHFYRKLAGLTAPKGSAP